ncbi:putative transposase [Shigella sonnei 3233-85]|nr:putative transposase [Shigella sonnei 3233-85]
MRQALQLADVVKLSEEEWLKWHTEFGHLNRGDMLTSEQHRCSNEKKKF